jgi:hypothetical protein
MADSLASRVSKLAMWIAENNFSATPISGGTRCDVCEAITESGERPQHKPDCILADTVELEVAALEQRLAAISKWWENGHGGFPYQEVTDALAVKDAPAAMERPEMRVALERVRTWFVKGINGYPGEPLVLPADHPAHAAKEAANG